MKIYIFLKVLPPSHLIWNIWNKVFVWNKVLTKRTTDTKMLKLSHLVQDPHCFNTWCKPVILTLTYTFAWKECGLKEILQKTHCFQNRGVYSTPSISLACLCFHFIWWTSNRRKHESFFSPKAIVVQFCQKICSYILLWYYILSSHNCVCKSVFCL